MADLDGDGDLEIVIGGTNTNGKLYAFNYDGTAVSGEPGWSGGILLDGSAIESSPVIGDIDGQTGLEIVIGTDDGNVYAFHTNGSPVSGWPKACIWQGVAGAVKSTPVIDDIDGDGKVEIVVATTIGLFRFDLDASYNSSQMPWPTFHQNNRRTGVAP